MINLSGILFALITVLGHGFDPGAFCVTVFIASIRASELPVDIDDDACLRCAWPSLVAGKNSFASRANQACLCGRKKAQRDADFAILPFCQPQRLTRESVHEQSAQATGRNGDEFTSFHKSVSGYFW